MQVLSDIAELAGLKARHASTRYACDLVVTMIGPRTMKRLNTSYLGHNWETDVLAFDLSDTPSPHPEDQAYTVGEIYICPAVAAKAAQDYGTSMAYELILYAAHGMLHLAGRKDASPADRAAMQKCEQHILAEIQTQYNLEELVE